MVGLSVRLNMKIVGKGIAYFEKRNIVLWLWLYKVKTKQHSVWFLDGLITYWECQKCVWWCFLGLKLKCQHYSPGGITFYGSKQPWCSMFHMVYDISKVNQCRHQVSSCFHKIAETQWSTCTGHIPYYCDLDFEYTLFFFDKCHKKNGLYDPECFERILLQGECILYLFGQHLFLWTFHLTQNKYNVRTNLIIQPSWD